MRAFLWHLSHDGSTTASRIYAFVMLTVVMTSLALLPLEFMKSFVQFHDVFVAVEGVVIIVLVIDLLLHLSCAPSFWKALFSWTTVVDILALLPFVVEWEVITALGWSLSDSQLHLLHLLRLLRLLELGRLRADHFHPVSELRSRYALEPTETVGTVAGKHMMAIVPLLLASAMLIAGAVWILMAWDLMPLTLSVSLSFGATAVFLLYRAFDTYTNEFLLVTTKRVMLQTSGFFRATQHFARHPLITRVEVVRPGFLAFLCGYGTLEMEWRGGQATMTMLASIVRTANNIRSAMAAVSPSS